jgi:pteridine reductase
VIVHYNTSAQEAEETAELIHASGGEAYLVKADLCSVAEIESVVSEVTAHWPVVDTLIHNAAVFFPIPLGTISEEDWDMTICSNLKGPFFLTQTLLPSLQQSAHPKIIMMGDIACETPAPRLIPYGISKMGLRAMVPGLARALQKIKVELIEIGPTLPPEDTRLQMPPPQHALDEVVERVMRHV